MKKCLILSDGPVPTPEHKKVEGGGLRCWGLAKGIAANSPDVAVTVAYNADHKIAEGFTSAHEGIAITTWTIDKIRDLLHEFDTIVVSYCMGDLSVRVVDNIRPDQQLVLDCYVPIYIEVSARGSADIDGEYRAFAHDVPRWSHVLKRGDLFLCASKAQYDYYQGVLSAVGRINPATYGQEQILIVPYGIYREKPKPKEKPVTKLLGDNVRKVLWFGGIYPWFDLRALVDGVQLLNMDVPSKLMIVGARNPFNSHPDFVKRSQELEDHVNSSPELKEMVAFQDWVNFDDRADWYLDSDVVMVINKEGPENHLAWRTRLVDFLWADLPILTNGGDPLGEKLIGEGAAIRLTGFDDVSIAKSLKSFLKSDDQLEGLRKNLVRLRPDYYWDTVTKELTSKIIERTRSADLTRFGVFDTVLNPVGRTAQLKKVARKAKMLPKYTQKYGVKNTYAVIRTAGIGRIKHYLPIDTSERPPRVIFVAHQLDLSGAPYVFLEAVGEFKRTYPNIPTDFYTFNPTHPDNIVTLNKMGIKPKLHITKDVGINLKKGDVVVLNTVAHSPVLKDSVFRSLEKNEASKLVWYIHEDEPEMQFERGDQMRILKLLNAGKLEMFIISKHATKNYQEFFGTTKNIHEHQYRFDLPKKYHAVRPPKDFDKLRFMLPGTMGDGRKGQLPIFYALTEFKQRYYDQNPEKYRDFELVYVGMETDFLSRQILNHAEKGLGAHFVHFPKMSRNKVLDMMLETNVTICYSLRECLPLFVFEGMLAGHPIMRNDASGIEEQLREGKNGYKLDSHDFEQVIESFERILNKKTVTNKQLTAMSEVSNGIAEAYKENSYAPVVNAIGNSFLSVKAK